MNKGYLRDPLSRAPYAKLLIPALTSILVSTYTEARLPFIIAGIIGFAVIIASNLIPIKHKYQYRWMFGAGLFGILFSIFAFSNTINKAESELNFTAIDQHYIATVNSIAQEKPKTIAVDLRTTYPEKKKVVAYFQKDIEARNLTPGDEVVFYSTIQPFKNLNNPGDFDYERYMNNKGYAGSTYISENSWDRTGRINYNITTLSQQFRLKALKRYEKYDLSSEAFSFLSALTLGYKDDLSQEVKESFQASGTSHILAVSGMHVAIVYAVLAFVLSFITKIFRRKSIMYYLIIIALWIYASLTGMSPSVVRATIMLTIALWGLATSNRVDSYNILAASAFYILLLKPLQLYDVGFQMSFAAVLSILYFNPRIGRLVEPQSKFLKYIWGLATLSISAQIGVLPITLYYFGTFPTYFFIANILIVPAIAIVVYTLVTLLTVSTLLILKIDFFTTITSSIKWVLEQIVSYILKTASIIESLPASQIQDIQFTGFQVLISASIIISAILFSKNKKPKYAIVLLSFILIFTSSVSLSHLKPNDNYIVVYNTPGRNDISLLIDNKKQALSYKSNGFIPHNSKSILILSDNYLINEEHIHKMSIDILIISNDKTFSIDNINKYFTYNTIIFDSSLPQYIKDRWAKECEVQNIVFHDVSHKGAYFIKI